MFSIQSTRCENTVKNSVDSRSLPHEYFTQDKPALGYCAIPCVKTLLHRRGIAASEGELADDVDSKFSPGKGQAPADTSKLLKHAA